MNSAEYQDLKAQLDRLEALFLAWIAPTVGEQNRQRLTMSKEQRDQANKDLLRRKRLELKTARK